MSKTATLISELLNEGEGSSGCLMVRFPVADTIEIQEWVDKNIPVNDIVKPERETHITILYGIKGCVPVSEIEAFVSQLPYIVVQFKSIDLFNQPDQDVLKITVDSPQLQEINRRLIEHLGPDKVEPSKYEYNPHVTLAYVKSGSCDRFKGNDRFNGYIYLLKQVVYSEPQSITKHEFNLSN